jgi:hypothetical protein
MRLLAIVEHGTAGRHHHARQAHGRAADRCTSQALAGRRYR